MRNNQQQSGFLAIVGGCRPGACGRPERSEMLRGLKGHTSQPASVPAIDLIMRS